MAPKNTVYRPEFLDFIAEHVSIGVPQRVIAQALGVNEETLKGWIHRKKELKLKIATLETAEARKRLKDVGNEFWLTRKYPEFKDKNQTVDVNLTLKNMTDEEIKAKIKELTED